MTRVLIVDDSPSIRLLLVRRLEMAGHETIEASDGRRALAAMDEAGDGERPEIVLLDAMLPDAERAGSLDAIKGAHPEVPVLIVSAVSGLAQDPEWGAADGHLAKPIDFDDLLGRIEALTSGPPRP